MSEKLMQSYKVLTLLCKDGTTSPPCCKKKFSYYHID